MTMFGPPTHACVGCKATATLTKAEAPMEGPPPKCYSCGGVLHSIEVDAELSRALDSADTATTPEMQAILKTLIPSKA
ncbi:MAG TPA: hypothetical protein VJL39_00830 [Candidatus Paceibacterota bacterium]